MYDSVSFFKRLGHLTGTNKARYAKRHGYDMIYSTPEKTSGILKLIPCNAPADQIFRGPDSQNKCWTEDQHFDIDHRRAPTFGKIKLTLAACDGRRNGWILWTDADAMVINQTIPLEALIDDAYDMMLAYDWLMLNAGMLLFKCSDWTTSFLHTVYDARKFDRARALDQSSFQEHLDNLTARERDAHVKVVPKYAMNVYTEEYHPGDFLLHMAGKLYEATEQGLFAIANQYDMLSMVDDIEDIQAFFRGRRLLNYYSGTCRLDVGHRQAECKPDDDRRILLNESLGSMSYPNRYRHVGLRYYWLGNWKDKYDVPGWDVKKKALPMPVKRRGDMPAPPPAAFHHGAGHQGNDGDRVDIKELGKIHVKADDHPPEVDHDGDNVVKKDKNADKDDANDDDDNDDLESEGWPIFVYIIIVCLIGAAIAGALVFLRRRKTKVSKMQ